jgi:serine/alanine adding enzyme
MYRLITDPKKIQKQQWSDFVFSHPDGNIFQTLEMVELHNKEANSIVVACFDEVENIVGILVALILREYENFLGNLSARAIVWGGPLILENGNEITTLILAEFDKICNKKVIYSQFRNLWNVEKVSSAFYNSGYSFEEHLDIISDLTLSEQILYKKIVPNGRNKISKAIRAGTIVKPIVNKDSLKDIYSILDEVYKKIKLPLPHIKYFESAWDIMFHLGYLKCFGAYNNNILIGVRIELIYKKTIYDWYAGGLTYHLDKFPNDILPWEIIKWGSENGFDKFDFGGAGKPNIPYGVRDFKMKYGGTLVNYGRFEKVHKPFLMSIARVGFKFWKLLKR